MSVLLAAALLRNYMLQLGWCVCLSVSVCVCVFVWSGFDVEDLDESLSLLLHQHDLLLFTRSLS